MLQTAENVLKDVKSKKYAPCYFLHGDESYYIDAIADEIENNALSSSEKGFNQTILYGKDMDMGILLQQARRFPMMAEKQVVIVKEFQQMPDLNRNEGKILLEKYIAHIQPSTILVLCHKHKTLNKNTTLYKNLEKHTIVVESKKLTENKVYDWINMYCKEKGHIIDQKAGYMLLEAIGAEISRLKSEIDKLLLNLAPQQTIQEKDIETNIGISKDFNVFELQKALAVKQYPKVFQILKYWEQNPKSQPIVLTLALLFQYFCKLILAHQSTDKSDNGLALTMGIPSFFVKDYKPALKNYSLPKLIQIIAAFRQADLQVKGIVPAGETDAEILKELMNQILFL